MMCITLAVISLCTNRRLLENIHVGDTKETAREHTCMHFYPPPHYIIMYKGIYRGRILFSAVYVFTPQSVEYLESYKYQKIMYGK